MYAFGSNAYGQLGLGNTKSVNKPMPVDASTWPAGRLKELHCGPNCTAALLTDGTVMQTGVSSNNFRPVARLLGKEISSISLTATHLVACSAVMNSIHQIPLQALGDQPSTISTQEPIVSVSSGALFTVCLTKSGKCLSFGMNAFGALGSGDDDEKIILDDSFAIVVPVEDDPFISIACGSGHAIAITYSGAVYSWGRNNHGQLGIGTVANESKPTKVQGVEEKAVAVAAGDYQSFIIGQTGNLYACGCNDQGQLGVDFTALHDIDNYVDDHAEPTRCTKFVPLTRIGSVVSVASGGGHGMRHTVAMTTNGLFVWGSNGCGQLGLPDDTICFTPKKLELGITPYQFGRTVVRCGWRHTFVWNTDLTWTPQPSVQPTSVAKELKPSTFATVTNMLSSFMKLVATRPGAPAMDQVCADACMIITEYVGTGRDAFNLALTCTTWNEYVRFSPAFYRLLKNKFPAKYRVVKDKHADEDPLDVDWRQYIPKHATSSSEAALPKPKGFFSKLFSDIWGGFGKKDRRILLVGLDASGKTTMLYKLKLGETITTIPTIGFNVESVTYKNINFTCWDVGGPDKLRALWRHYYENTHAMILMVDSHDKDRIHIAKEEVHKAMTDPLMANAKLLVMANKQDLPNALSPTEVAERLNLHTLGQDWYIQACCAVTGDGLFEGLDWLSHALR